MKPLRWLGASLIGLVAGVLGLVGVLLCVTVIGLPLGIPVLMLAGKLGRWAGQLVVPRKLRHPVQELEGAASDAAGEVGSRTGDLADTATSSASKSLSKADKRLRRVTKKGSGVAAAVQKAPKRAKHRVPFAG